MNINAILKRLCFEVKLHNNFIYYKHIAHRAKWENEWVRLLNDDNNSQTTSTATASAMQVMPDDDDSDENGFSNMQNINGTKCESMSWVR